MISRRTKFWLSAAALFFIFFALGITDWGQQVLRGDTSKITDHWKLDDVYMGTGLAPIAWGLLPALFCLILAGFSYYGDRDSRS